MKFRTRYNEEENTYFAATTAIDFTGDPGKTLQEPAEDADINILMKRMGVKDGSQLPYFPDARAIYGDFSEMPTDPVEIADMMHEANLAFLRIPAAVRQRYRSPEELFQFMNNPENYDEAVKLGLLEKKEQVKPDKMDVLIDKIDTMVSSSTSRDKESLVQPAPSAKEKK